MRPESATPPETAWEELVDRVLDFEGDAAEEGALVDELRRLIRRRFPGAALLVDEAKPAEPPPPGWVDVETTGPVRLFLRVRAGAGNRPRRFLRVLACRMAEARRGVPLRARGADVTGAPAAEVREAVEQLQAREHQLLQSINAIIWEAPIGSRSWSFVSEGAVVMLGYPVSRWMGEGFWRSILHAEDRDRVIAQSGALRGDRDLEYRVHAADGRVVWLHDAVRVIWDAAGTIVAQRGVMLDVSVRKESELGQARAQAEMVDLQKLESLGVMAGGIAHDFNNLLTVILGNASLAAMRLPDRSPARSAIDDLIANAQRAADLTRHLLSYAGRAQLTTEPLELSGLVRKLQGLLTAAVPKGVKVDVSVDPLVPAVDGDSTQLQQVVMNLVTNAGEALESRSGTVSIRTGFRRLTGEAAAALHLAEGGYVVLSVEDDGPGMDEETRRRMFDPFFTTRSQGRGLGLAAVHGIVKGHGGAVEVRSAAGAGTTVSVLLPASASPPPARAPLAAPIRVGSGLVLVIDDESEVRATARAMLEALGYDVMEAEDGRMGLLFFDRHRSDIRVVLLDMTMPVMSGEEVLRELLRRDPTANIVLSTGFSEIDARRRGMAGGLRGFLQKPYTVRQLAEVIGDAAQGPAGSA
jgi:PAS domain S-box-containing protein